MSPDTAYYKCEASNDEDVVESTAVVRVALGAFGTLPKNFPPASVDFTGKEIKCNFKWPSMHIDGNARFTTVPLKP